MQRRRRPGASTCRTKATAASLIGRRAKDLLRADSLDGLDRERRHARLLGDSTILRFHLGAGRLIAVEPAKQGRRDLAVRALAAVLIDDIEQNELRARRWLGHGDLSGCFRVGLGSGPDNLEDRAWAL